MFFRRPNRLPFVLIFVVLVLSMPSSQVRAAIPQPFSAEDVAGMTTDELSALYADILNHPEWLENDFWAAVLPLVVFYIDYDNSDDGTTPRRYGGTGGGGAIDD